MLCSGPDHLPTCSTVQRLHTCRRDNECIPGLQARWAPFAEAVGDAWLGQLTWCQAGTAAQPGQFQLCGLSLVNLLDQKVLGLQVAVGYAGCM